MALLFRTSLVAPTKVSMKRQRLRTKTENSDLERLRDEDDGETFRRVAENSVDHLPELLLRRQAGSEKGPLCCEKD